MGIIPDLEQWCLFVFMMRMEDDHVLRRESGFESDGINVGRTGCDIRVGIERWMDEWRMGGQTGYGRRLSAKV